jgi:chaperone BCS1
MPLQELIASLSANPYFNAGFGLIGLGTGLALLKTSYRHALVVGRRHLLVSLEIPSRDRSYNWVLQWISRQNTFGVGGAGSGLKTQHLSVQTYAHQYESGMMETRFEFLPSPGRHLLLYKGLPSVSVFVCGVS